MQQDTGSAWSLLGILLRDIQFATDYDPQEKEKKNRYQDERLPTSPQQGKMQTGFVEISVKTAST